MALAEMPAQWGNDEAKKGPHNSTVIGRRLEYDRIMHEALYSCESSFSICTMLAEFVASEAGCCGPYTKSSATGIRDPTTGCMFGFVGNI